MIELKYYTVAVLFSFAPPDFLVSIIALIVIAHIFVVKLALSQLTEARGIYDEAMAACHCVCLCVCADCFL